MHRLTGRTKYLALATAGILVFSTTTAYSVTTTLDGAADFFVALVLNGTSMSFSNISMSTLTVTGSAVQLGTNGALGFSGVFAAGSPSTPVAGRVDITNGTNGQTLEFRCDATATLTRTGGGSIQLNNIEVVAENATGAYGAGNACNGVGGSAAMTLVLNLGTLDGFVLGGQLDGSTASSFVAGSYSTGNAGGDSIDIDVSYQEDAFY